MRTWHIAVIIVLAFGLVASVALNLFSFLQPITVIGVADSKSIGEGRDLRGEPKTWYTVSLVLVTDDRENGLGVGDTLAYIIDKDDFDRIENDAVITGRLRDRAGLEVLELSHLERFATGHGLFYPGSRGQ